VSGETSKVSECATANTSLHKNGVGHVSDGRTCVMYGVATGRAHFQDGITCATSVATPDMVTPMPRAHSLTGFTLQRPVPATHPQVIHSMVYFVREVEDEQLYIQTDIVWLVRY
jgi:hypothetical protein